MKRRIIIILAAIGVILFGGLAFYVQSDAFSDRITPPATAYLKKVLGPDLVVGRVKAGLIPLFVEIRDVAVPDETGAYVVTVRKARVYINPLPLVIGRLSIPSITVLEPRISIVRSTDGSVNLVRLIKSAILPTPLESGKPLPRFAVSLGSLTIKNGSAAYTDVRTETRYRAARIAIRIRADLQKSRASLLIMNSEIVIAGKTATEMRLGLKASVDYAEGKLDVRTFNLTSSDAWAAISGSAAIEAQGPLDLKLRARFEPSMIKKLTGSQAQPSGPQLPRLDISASVKGTVADPVLEGTVTAGEMTYRNVSLSDAALEVTYRGGNLVLKGRRWKLERGGEVAVFDSINAALEIHAGGMNIRKVAIDGDDVDLKVDGTVDFKQGYDVTINIKSGGQNRLFNVFTPKPFEGGIAVTGRLRGAMSAPRFDGAVAAENLSVRGVMFSQVGGRLVYGNRKLEVRNAEIRQMTSRYGFEGVVDFSGKKPVFTARLDVIRSDVASIVSLFYKPLPLELTAKGEMNFSGTTGSYSGSAYLSLDKGKAYGETFDSGTVKISLETGRVSFSQVMLYKGNGVVRGNGWIGFDRTYEADIRSRYVDLSEVNFTRALPLSGLFRLDIVSSGSFRNPYVRAALEIPDFAYSGISAGECSGVLEISDHTLEIKAGDRRRRVGLSGTLALRAPFAWSADLTVHADNLDPLMLIGKKDFKAPIGITIDGTLAMTGTGADYAKLNASASVSRLQVTIAEYQVQNERPAELTVQDGKLTLKPIILTGPGTNLEISGKARLLKDIDVKVNGSASLSLLRILYQEVEHGDGFVDIKIAVTDKWNRPEISGDLSIRNGTIKIRDIPLKFTGLNGKLSLTEGLIQVDSLGGEMGGGSLEMSGWLQLSGFSLRDFSFKAAGSGITVRYPEGMTSTLNGELYYDGNESEQLLSGDVEIKQARYEKRVEWKSMLLEMARGLYQKKKTDVGWIGDTQLNIRFHGKEGILLRNNLATIPFDVDLLLRGTINKLQLVGRLDAGRGVVFFRNNEFNILHASADFIDPTRLNPVLDIQAETRVHDYLIRLSVTGTAERAAVTFISEPPLSDEDILGVLALGKTGAELKGKGTGVGMGEAISFATGQFQDIFEQRARSLTGLDRFQVDPYISKGDTSVPRVTVGKEIIRNKLYVTYSSNVGATDAEQLLKVEYILNRNLSFVGQQDELGKIGADVKFRFEFK